MMKTFPQYRTTAAGNNAFSLFGNKSDCAKNLSYHYSDVKLWSSSSCRKTDPRYKNRPLLETSLFWSKQRYRRVTHLGTMWQISLSHFHLTIVTRLIKILQWDQLHPKISYFYFLYWFFQIFNFIESNLN